MAVELVSVAEVAERLEISEFTVRRFIKRGEYPAIRVKSEWHVIASALRLPPRIVRETHRDDGAGEVQRT